MYRFWSDASPKFCGREIPPSVTTTSDLSRVTFVSNGEVDGDGFKVRLKNG